jgi:toxin FitB
MRQQSPLDLAISVLTLGEIEHGITLLPTGRKRAALETWLTNELPKHFQNRVLSLDETVAREWGRLSARSRTSGRPLPLIDGILLATAAVHGLTFVTRNEADCAARGVPVLNPWREG